jgi:hypothetical protein
MGCSELIKFGKTAASRLIRVSERMTSELSGNLQVRLAAAEERSGLLPESLPYPKLMQPDHRPPSGQAQSFDRRAVKRNHSTAGNPHSLTNRKATK